MIQGKRYWSDSPCRNHPATVPVERYTSNGNYALCQSIRRNAAIQKFRAENPDLARQRGRQYRDPKKNVENSKAWRLKNPERHAANNRHQASLRRARLAQACPAWVDRAALRAVYLNCPDDQQVDHIVPLKGRRVCGLHVPWNLRYVTKRRNLKKSNKFREVQS